LRDWRNSTIVTIAEGDTPLQRISALMEKEGCTLRSVSSREEGLALTRELHPDLVIDLLLDPEGLPCEDSLALCREIRNDEALRLTYMLLAGSGHPLEARKAALDAEADEYLDLNSAPEDLLADIHSVVTGARLIRDMQVERHRDAIRLLATTLGHQIGNPLTGLMGHLKLASIYLKRGDYQRIEHHLEEIDDSVRRIGDVSRRLIGMSEPKTTQYLGNREMLDLGDNCDVVGCEGTGSD
jgi:CheY-like chemotaxis protein